MTFDAIGFLAIAHEMGEQSEAHVRTAVNRAYYGVFLKTRDSLLQHGMISGRREAQEHGEVIWALRNNRRVVAAAHLARLRALREQADYDTASTAGAMDAREALAVAEEVQRLLARDWAAA